MAHSARIGARLAQRKPTVILNVNVKTTPDVTPKPENAIASPDGRERFVPSPVKRARMVKIVTRPVVAITTQPVTHRTAPVFVLPGTLAKNVQKSVQLDSTGNSAQKNATVKMAPPVIM